MKQEAASTGVLVILVLGLLTCLITVAGRRAELQREAVEHGYGVILKDSGFQWIEPQALHIQ